MWTSSAVNDSRRIAPVGYHFPFDEEWTKLTDYLGGENVAGTKMKSKTGWGDYEGEIERIVCKSWTPEQKAGQTCNTCNDKGKITKKISGNGTNSSGFSGLPGGNRDYDGPFDGVGK